MKSFYILSLLLLNFYCANATRFVHGGEVVIGDPVFEDLYVAGGKITINAPVHGDLIVAGGTVIINDTVTNDILLAGGKIIFNGFAGDDIRCAGGNIEVQKDVAGDVIITGGRITIAKNVTLGGLVASGGNVVVDGDVTGPIKCASGKFELNGNALNAVDCRGGTVIINGMVGGEAILSASEKVIIGKGAVFQKEVRFWTTSKKLEFEGGERPIRAVYDPSLGISIGKWFYLGFKSLFSFLWYLGTITMLIIVMQLLFRKSMKASGEVMFINTIRSIGLGVLYWIAVPVLVLICFITLIGIPIGVILLIAYIFLAIFSSVVTAVVFANWLGSRSPAEWKFWKLVLTAIGVFIIIKIISWTPFLGSVLTVILVCLAFGAIITVINKRKSVPVIN